MNDKHSLRTLKWQNNKQFTTHVSDCHLFSDMNISREIHRNDCSTWTTKEVGKNAERIASRVPITTCESTL